MLGYFAITIKNTKCFIRDNKHYATTWRNTEKGYIMHRKHW